MMRFTRVVLVMLVVLLGVAPGRVEASEKCWWVWVSDDIYIDTNTGEIIIPRTCKWFCDGQPDPV